MKKLFVTVQIFLLGCFIVHAQITEWSKANNFSGWHPLRNLKLNVSDGTIKLTDIQYDSSIICSPVSIDPKEINSITIRYRAQNIARHTTGQIFFTNQKGEFGKHSYFRLRSLEGDGQWHNIVATTRNIKNPEDWTLGGIITQLRIDMADQPGGLIEIQSIVLQNNPLLKYSAAVNDEPAWPKLKPDFRGGEKITGEPYFTGCMICAQKDCPTHPLRLSYQLRRTFRLAKLPAESYIQLLGDDKATAWLNGHEIVHNNSWRKPNQAEIPSKYFHPGENVLAIVYQNVRSSGGVLGELFIKDVDGKIIRINTDGKFKSLVVKKIGTSDWMLPGFDDKSWEPVVTLDPPPGAPWKHRIRYIDYAVQARPLELHLEGDQVKAGKRSPLILKFIGETLPKSLPLDVTLTDCDGICRWREHCVISTSGIHKSDTQHWEARCEWLAPRFLPTGRYHLTLIPMTLPGNESQAFQLDILFQAQPKPATKIRFGTMRTPSGMQFCRDGKPFYAVCGNVSCYGSLSQFFSAARVNVRTVYTNGWWTGEQQFDFGCFDRAVEACYRYNPDALLLIDINLDMPKEWFVRHKEEITANEHRTLSGDRVMFSFASRKARKDLIEAMRHAIQYCENSRYCNRIMGYRITGGDTTEWLGWPWSKHSLPDYSTPARTMFREYLKKHYPILSASTPIPTTAERLAGDGNAVLLNSSAHLPVLAYSDFYSFMIADTLAALCREARNIVGDTKVIGSYYGYTFHISSGYYSQMRGHYALEYLLNAAAGSLNFLMSPQSYRVRRPGDTSADMKPFQSLKNHGIISLIEDDTRTNNGVIQERFTDSQYQAVNPQQSLNFCRRNFGIALARLQPIMMYSLASTEDFALPALVPALNAIVESGQFAIDHHVTRHAEIAVVVSEKSPKYVAACGLSDKSRYRQYYSANGKPHRVLTGGLRVVGDSITWQLTNISRMGAPVDYLLFEDLADNPGDYKLYMFLNCYAYDDKLLAAVKKLQTHHTTLFWLYAPGYYRNNRNDSANMKTLTGIELKAFEHPQIPALKLSSNQVMGVTTAAIEPLFYVPPQNSVKMLANYVESDRVGLAETTIGDARSVFCGAYNFSTEFLRNWAQTSGVYLYDNNLDPMDANAAFYTLHARTPGQKTINLPKTSDVLDVFSGKIIARGVRQFSFNAPLHSSWLFYYGNEADALAELLRK